MGYSYTTTYLVMPYLQNEKGFWIFKGKDYPFEPDFDRFVEDPETAAQLNKMAAEGYELCSVQPVLRTVIMNAQSHGPQPHGFAYPLTAGFVLIWRRKE